MASVMKLDIHLARARLERGETRDASRSGGRGRWLFARIGELFAGRSVLLISRGFSTVRAADRIYVLNEGASGGIGHAFGIAGSRGDVRGAVYAAGVAVPVVCGERYQAAASGLRIYVPRSGHEFALDNRPA